MKKKILSVLLAVMMIVGLLPLAQLFANATEPETAEEYDYVYYISNATGAADTNDGLTPATPKKTFKAIYDIFKVNELASDDTAVIYVIGDVQMEGGSNWIFGHRYKTDSGVDNWVTIRSYHGEGYENKEATLYFSVASVGNGTSRKGIHVGNFHFKDVTIAPDLAEANETGVTQLNILYGGSTGKVIYDDVTFSKTDYTNPSINVHWQLMPMPSSVTSCSTNSYLLANWSDTNAILYDHTITFLNGDYRHVDVSGTMPQVDSAKNNAISWTIKNGVQQSGSYYSKSAENAAGKSVTYRQNSNIVIGAGAQMGEVSAACWNYAYYKHTVTVQAGATVEELYAMAPTVLDFSYDRDIAINVESGATVKKLQTYADHIDYLGTLSNGTEWAYLDDKGEVATAVVPSRIKANITVQVADTRQVLINGEVPTYNYYVNADPAIEEADGFEARDGKTAETAYANITAAFNALVNQAKTFTVVGQKPILNANVYVSGAVKESGSAGNAFFLNTNNVLGCKVNVIGSDDASIAIVTNADTNNDLTYYGTATRKNAVNHFTFQNIKFTLTPATGTTLPPVMTIGTMCDMVLDNVTFDDALTTADEKPVKWAISADANAGSYIAPFHSGATQDNILTLSSSLTLKNGDYSGNHLILAAGGSHDARVNVDSDAVAGVTDYRTSNRWFHYTSTLNIGEGAIVDKVAGQSWSNKFPEIVDYRVVVNALPGSKVNTINGTTDQWKVDSTADIYINVDPSVTKVAGDAAPVINAYGTAEHVYHHGSVIIGEGFESKGASLVIDSKVGALVLFDKAVIADPSNVAYSVCNDPTTGKTTTFSAPVATGTELITQTIGDVEYYAIQVPGVAPENFDDTYVTVAGFGFPQIVFTMNELVEKASDAWAGDETWAPVAEAVTNLGIAANGGTPEFTTEPALDRSAKVALSSESAANVLTGYSLHIDNAVGITLQFADGVTVTANGTELEDGVNAKMTATTATVFVNAKSLRHGFTFVATDEHGNEAELVVSVWQVAQVYANITNNDDVTDAHKAQAKAVLAYIEALDGIPA